MARVKRRLPFLNVLTETVCEIHDVTQSQLFSPMKLNKYVRARWSLYYLMQTKMNMSLPEIGIVFNKHHTTILHGIEEFKRLLRTDDEILEKLRTIIKLAEVRSRDKPKDRHRLLDWMEDKGIQLDELQSRANVVLMNLDLLLARKGYRISVSKLKEEK